MSGKKAKQARNANPVSKQSVSKCPTRVEVGQIWKSGTFVSGQQVVDDLKVVARRLTHRAVLPSRSDDEKVVAALSNFDFIRALNEDTRDLIRWSAEAVGTTEEGVLAELLANNIFPPQMSKKDWLDKGYAGTWLTEEQAISGLLRTDYRDKSNEAIASEYKVIASISPLNVSQVDSGRVVVSSVLPNNRAGRAALAQYVRTGSMPSYLIP